MASAVQRGLRVCDLFGVGRGDVAPARPYSPWGKLSHYLFSSQGGGHFGANTRCRGAKLLWSRTHIVWMLPVPEELRLGELFPRCRSRKSAFCILSAFSGLISRFWVSLLRDPWFGCIVIMSICISVLLCNFVSRMLFLLKSANAYPAYLVLFPRIGLILCRRYTYAYPILYTEFHRAATIFCSPCASFRFPVLLHFVRRWRAYICFLVL